MKLWSGVLLCIIVISIFEPIQRVLGAEEDLFDRSKLSGDWSGK